MTQIDYRIEVQCPHCDRAVAFSATDEVDEAFEAGRLAERRRIAAWLEKYGHHPVMADWLRTHVVNEVKQ